MTHAALGLRAHSGWAALVVVAGAPRSPAVIDRRRMEIADPQTPEAKQPYHAAAELELKEADKLIKRCTDGARRLAQRALCAVLEDLRDAGHQVVGCGLLLGSGRPPTPLEATLASHALIHTAEGELFRQVLTHACEQCALRVTGVRERELFARGAAELSVPPDALRRRVTELGRSVGPPWRQDEKYAALVAWLALAAASQRDARRSTGREKPHRSK
jgi:hypothetical protein